jgi:hypothetical protein
VDVRRQRHLAHGLGVTDDLDGAHTVAEIGADRDRDGLRPLRGHDVAVAQAPPRAHEGLPAPAAEVGHQQHLDLGARPLAAPQPGPAHAGVVHDDHVARPDELGQVRHPAVVRRLPRAPVHEEPGGVAGLDRVLGDGRLRQVVVELVGPHGWPEPGTAGRTSRRGAR